MNDILKACFSSFLKDPQEVSFDGMDDNEKVVLLMRMHVIKNVPWIVFTIVLVLAPILVYQFFKFGGVNLNLYLPANYQRIALLFWYLCVFMYAFESYLTWYFNVYIVTTKKVIDIDFFGILSRRVSDCSISKIQDATYTVMGILPTIFNYGFVYIQTAGEDKVLEYDFVPRPAYVHDVISDLAAKIKGDDVL